MNRKYSNFLAAVLCISAPFLFIIFLCIFCSNYQPPILTHENSNYMGTITDIDFINGDAGFMSKEPARYIITLDDKTKVIISIGNSNDMAPLCASSYIPTIGFALYNDNTCYLINK